METTRKRPEGGCASHMYTLTILPRRREMQCRRTISLVPPHNAFARTEFVQELVHYINEVGPLHPTLLEAAHDLHDCLRQQQVGFRADEEVRKGRQAR